jgi:Domain of unknown function (DUF1963)
MMRPSVALTAVEVAEPLPPLSTKVGGLPDLPLGTESPTKDDGTPLPLAVQVNLTVLAELFPDLLPWPAGGGLLQLFSAGPASRTLVHRDLAGLRQGVPGPNVRTEYQLEPALQSCIPDPREYPPLWALREQLSPAQLALLDEWLWQCHPAPIQVGGSASWEQDPAHWEAWALDHGVYPSDDADDDPYYEKYNAARDNADEQAMAEGWQLVMQYSPNEHEGTFYVLAPLDPVGRWDLNRLQTIFQTT